MDQCLPSRAFLMFYRPLELLFTEVTITNMCRQYLSESVFLNMRGTGNKQTDPLQGCVLKCVLKLFEQQQE